MTPLKVELTLDQLPASVTYLNHEKAPMFTRPIYSIFAVLLIASVSNAQSTISTTFDNATFATGSTSNVTLTDGPLSAVFQGGFQEQSFHGPAYSDSNDAYFFINGTYTGSFGRPATGSTDVGIVDFNIGVDTLSFFASDLENGTPSFRVLGVDDTTVLASVSFSNSSATQFSFDSATLGAQIGSVEFDNAGPASAPPYGIAIDSFSASAIPEPSSATAILFAVAGFALRRRKNS